MSNPRNMFQIDDLQAYWEWEARQQARVEAALTDEQRGIGWGDCFLRPWVEPGWSGQAPMHIIFGRVFPLEELQQTEDEETIDQMEERFPRFVFANCYSVIEPRGEPGDVNRYHVWPITHEQFAQAAHNAWRVDETNMDWVTGAVTEMMVKRRPFEDEPLPPGVTPA